MLSLFKPFDNYFHCYQHIVIARRILDSLTTNLPRLENIFLTLGYTINFYGLTFIQIYNITSETLIN